MQGSTRDRTAAVTRFFGVDVAKAELVCVEHGGAAAEVICNEPAAIGRWLAKLPAGSVLAMEATGRYHAVLAQMAHAAGLRVYVLNARDVYFYARALGGRGKTDRLDAAVIARYAAEHHARLRAWVPPAAALAELQALLRRRAQLSTQWSAMEQSVHDMPQLRHPMQLLSEQFKALLRSIDTQMSELLSQRPGLAERVALLRTISGVGPQGSLMLAELFSRIEFDNADALVAYAGLDPRPCDSGQRRGKRRLSKRGPAHLRRQLYLAAFGASHSHALKPLYESIKGKGFASTPALVILARKLLRVAWAVWRSGKAFDASRLIPASP
jgi:transposase